eukprot:gene9233-19148_t
MADIPNEGSTFTYLRNLDDRCRRLSDRESEYLGSFYNYDLRCFQIYPYLNTNRISITSSCIAVNAIIASPENWEGICSWESTADKGISLKEIVNGLMAANWTSDSFQTPVIISTLSNLKAIDPENQLYIEAVETLVDRRSRLSLHRSQTQSTYIRYKNTRALLDVVENKLIPSSLIGTHLIGNALERANVVAFDELCRQLAFYNSGDRANFDVIILTYSLLTYYETSQSIFRISYARGVIEATNIKLVKAALAIIFNSQAEDGTWRKGEPIFTQNELGNKRDIGNSYVFFFELIGGILGPLADNEPTLLAPFLPQLERCVTWAESNILQEMLPEICDPKTFRCHGSLVRGWRSNHLGTGGAACWCTAQVFLGLTRIRKLLRTLTTNSILEEFGGRRSGPISEREWEILMDADLDIAGMKSTLKNELQGRFLQPLLNRDIATSAALLPPSDYIYDNGNGNLLPLSTVSVKPSYSAILFGPPGTAKTTICTSIAAALGWNFLTIDTADFLADGLQNIASRMTYVFDRLRALERTIILFDEVEEFCLDRENPNLAMESRMLTTAMLTQLNDLRRQQASAFIVATNRLRSFDAAVTRPGRFDMLLFVGTPNLAARDVRIGNKLLSSRLSVEEQEKARTTAREFMDSRWETMRFLTFAESDAFANAVVELASRGELSRETLVARFGIIQRTSTIQGAIREDYLASESLSRV